MAALEGRSGPGLLSSLPVSRETASIDSLGLGGLEMQTLTTPAAKKSRISQLLWAESTEAPQGPCLVFTPGYSRLPECVQDLGCASSQQNAVKVTWWPPWDYITLYMTCSSVLLPSWAVWWRTCRWPCGTEGPTSGGWGKASSPEPTVSKKPGPGDSSVKGSPTVSGLCDPQRWGWLWKHILLIEILHENTAWWTAWLQSWRTTGKSSQLSQARLLIHRGTMRFQTCKNCTQSGKHPFPFPFSLHCLKTGRIWDYFPHIRILLAEHSEGYLQTGRCCPLTSIYIKLTK